MYTSYWSQFRSLLIEKQKQTVTVDSSTVAELIAAHLATKEIMWARLLLAEMGYPQVNPTINIVNNDCNSQKTKHIDIRYDLVREQVKKIKSHLCPKHHLLKGGVPLLRPPYTPP